MYRYSLTLILSLYPAVFLKPAALNPQAENLGAPINSAANEEAPFITPDEKYLFFQSDRQSSQGNDNNDLWFGRNPAKKKGKSPVTFQKPENVGLPVNSDEFDGQPALRVLAPQEIEMVFASTAAQGRSGPGLTNLYYSIWRNGKWLEPVPIAELNTDYHDRMPALSTDGRFLFFSSDRPGGKGGDDIWVSERDSATGEWREAQNLAAINSEASEITPALNAEGTALFFASDLAGGMGGYDLYSSETVIKIADIKTGALQIAESAWSKPKNIGAPFNSAAHDISPSFTARGNKIYFASDRLGGIGGFDIYRASLQPVAPVATTEKKETSPAQTVPKPKSGLRFLGRVYFATDGHDKLVGDEEAFLKLVAERLKLHPRAKLLIVGHGDSRGTASYNKHLGEKRAAHTKKLLLEKGVRDENIRITSAGKSRPRYAKDNTYFKQQKNRRADLFITVPLSAAAQK
ncbi:MAG: PD40 domain-containing protein [Spirochaetes bacterium]|nr:PD40 domain-containing protein [Spirochaetota bacterium]